MAMGREALFTAGYLGLVPSLSRYAREAHGCGEEASRVMGAVGGGILVGTLSHPFDTVKTCQQVSTFSNIRACAFKLQRGRQFSLG
jgi:solute carrier family 25 citrate transporter 1